MDEKRGGFKGRARALFYLFSLSISTHVQQALAVLGAQGGEDVGQDEADGWGGWREMERGEEVERAARGGASFDSRRSRAASRASLAPSSRARWGLRVSLYMTTRRQGLARRAEGRGRGAKRRTQQSNAPLSFFDGRRPSLSLLLYSPWKKLDLPEPLAPTVSVWRGGVWYEGEGEEARGRRDAAPKTHPLSALPLFLSSPSYRRR